MSAPNTNLEKERRRHRGPLIGMIVVVLFVGVILLYWLSSEFSMQGDPGATDVDGASQSVGTADQGSTATEVDPLTNSEFGHDAGHDGHDRTGHRHHDHDLSGPG